MTSRTKPLPLRQILIEIGQRLSANQAYRRLIVSCVFWRGRNQLPDARKHVTLLRDGFQSLVATS